MRIAIWSTATEDKKQLISKFMETWKNYKVIDNFEPITESLTLEQTKELLDKTMDDIMNRVKDNNVFYSVCTLDLLSHAFLCAAREVATNTQTQHDLDLLMQKLFMLVRQSMHFYDVILYFPRTKTSIPETEYEAEINNFMNAINESYLAQKDWIFPFKDANGTPALVEFTGSVEENATMVKLYLNPEGKEYSKDDSLVSSILG